MGRLLLSTLGFSVAFIICGLIGAGGLVASVPQLREKCDEGIVCYALQLLRFTPKSASTADPIPVPAALPSTGCLTKKDRVVLYRLGMLLIGNPQPDSIAPPASLGLSDDGCMTVDNVADKLCRAWALAKPACDFEKEKTDTK